MDSELTKTGADITEQAVLKLTPDGALYFLFGIIGLIALFIILNYIRNRKRDVKTSVFEDSMINSQVLLQRIVIQQDIILAKHYNILDLDLISNVADRTFSLSKYEIIRLYCDITSSNKDNYEEVVPIINNKIRNLYNADKELMSKIKYDKLLNDDKSIGKLMDDDWAVEIQKVIMDAVLSKKNKFIVRDLLDSMFEQFLNSYIIKIKEHERKL